MKYLVTLKTDIEFELEAEDYDECHELVVEQIENYYNIYDDLIIEEIDEEL